MKVLIRRKIIKLPVNFVKEKFNGGALCACAAKLINIWHWTFKNIPYQWLAAMCPLSVIVKQWSITPPQGWEFAHQLFNQFAHFLWAKERFACEKEWIAPVALLSWATLANPSQSLFYNERRERIAHVAL